IGIHHHLRHSRSIDQEFRVELFVLPLALRNNGAAANDQARQKEKYSGARDEPSHKFHLRVVTATVTIAVRARAHRRCGRVEMRATDTPARGLFVPFGSAKATYLRAAGVNTIFPGAPVASSRMNSRPSASYVRSTKRSTGGFAASRSTRR